MDERVANDLSAVLAELAGKPEFFLVGGKRVSIHTPEEQLTDQAKTELKRYAINRLREVWKSS